MSKLFSFKLFCDSVSVENLNELGYEKVHRIKELENHYFLELNNFCNKEHTKNILKLIEDVMYIYPDVDLKDFINPEFFTAKLNIPLTFYVSSANNIGIKLNEKPIGKGLDYNTFIGKYTLNVLEHSDLLNYVLNFSNYYYQKHKENILTLLSYTTKYAYLDFSLNYINTNPNSVIVKTKMVLKYIDTLNFEKELSLSQVKNYINTFMKTYNENTISYNQLIQSDLARYFSFNTTNGNETLIQVVDDKILMLLPDKSDYTKECLFIKTLEDMMANSSFGNSKENVIICINILKKYLKNTKKSIDYLNDIGFLVQFKKLIKNLQQIMTDYVTDNILNRLDFEYLNKELKLFYVKPNREDIYPQYIIIKEERNGSEYNIIKIHDKYIKMLNKKLKTKYPVELYFKDNVRVSKKDYNLMKDAD